MEFCAWRDDGPAYRPPLVTEKVRSWNAAQRWREANPGQVVFTNGVFDLLHPGHLAALETARSWGDLLMVGINDDASAARLAKGRGRAADFIPFGQPGHPVAPQSIISIFGVGFTAEGEFRADSIPLPTTLGALGRGRWRR